MEQEVIEAMAATMERLAAANGMLEQAIARFDERQEMLSGEVRRIVAEVEQREAGEGQDAVRAELEQKLKAAEERIAALEASQEVRQESVPGSGRKTMPAVAISLLAKQGISSLDSLEGGALDSALNGLSIEQRIAVKSHLHRAGLL